MQQILVLYFSRSGNTQMLAEAIAKGISEVGVKALLKTPLDVTAEDFLQSSGIIVGSPVYFGTMAAELKMVFDKFIGLRKKMENKIGAAFTSSGHVNGGKSTTLMSIIQAMLIYGMMVVGDPMEATGHYGVGSVGCPNEVEQQNAEKLGKRVALLVKKLSTPD